MSSDEEIEVKRQSAFEQKNEGDEVKTYAIEQLQDYVSLGITEYIRDETNNLTARFLIEDSIEQMLKFSEDQYTREQIMEDIEVLSFSLINQLYQKLEQRVLGKR